jgi:hypothetical protein
MGMWTVTGGERQILRLDFEADVEPIQSYATLSPSNMTVVVKKRIMKIWDNIVSFD